MIEAILFDLDGTLLENDVQKFLNGYLPLSAEHTAALLDGKTLTAELMYGTQAMIKNRDGRLTNSDVFWPVFSERTGVPRERMQPLVDSFYRERFAELRPLTAKRPEARLIIQHCLARGLKVVIATNPVFPRAAIEQRLDWAGISPAEFRFDLITVYEEMHFTKPNVEYYEEILGKIGVDADRAMMVGDEWENDIAPPARLGLRTFWVNYDGQRPPDGAATLAGKGTLEEFSSRLSPGGLLDD
jgi:HAD superfamily hydrolase (TIGR01549 family)